MVANQLKRNGETLTDARIMEKILGSLTYDFESVVSVIEESRNTKEIIVDNRDWARFVRSSRNFWLGRVIELSIFSFLSLFILLLPFHFHSSLKFSV